MPVSTACTKCEAVVCAARCELATRANARSTLPKRRHTVGGAAQTALGTLPDPCGRLVALPLGRRCGDLSAEPAARLTRAHPRGGANGPSAAGNPRARNPTLVTRPLSGAARCICKGLQAASHGLALAVGRGSTDLQPAALRRATRRCRRLALAADAVRAGPGAAASARDQGEPAAGGLLPEGAAAREPERGLPARSAWLRDSSLARRGTGPEGSPRHPSDCEARGQKRSPEPRCRDEVLLGLARSRRIPAGVGSQPRNAAAARPRGRARRRGHRSSGPLWCPVRQRLRSRLGGKPHRRRDLWRPPRAGGRLSRPPSRRRRDPHGRASGARKRLVPRCSQRRGCAQQPGGPSPRSRGGRGSRDRRQIRKGRDGHVGRGHPRRGEPRRGGCRRQQHRGHDAGPVARREAQQRRGRLARRACRCRRLLPERGCGHRGPRRRHASY